MMDIQSMLSASAAGLATVVTGYALSWTSPTLTAITAEFDLHDFESSSYSGCMPLAAAVGAGVAGVFINYYGPYRGQCITCIVMTLGWVIQAVSQAYWSIMMGRLVTGLASGATTVCTPLFLNDVASEGHEGAFGFVVQVGISLGILLINAFGLATSSWRDLAWICVATSGLAVINFVFGVKTPPRPQKVVKKVKAPEDSAQKMWAPYIISYTLMVFQQLSGINVVIFFIGPLVDIAGLGRPDVISVYTMVVQLVAGLVATAVIDRAGKRLLLFVSSFGMMTALIMLGVFFFIQDQRLITGSIGDGKTNDVQAHTTGLALASIFIFIASFNFGMGPIPWSVIGEYFEPTELGSATSNILNWLLAFAVTQSLSPIMQAIGGGPTYMGYAFFNMLSCIFIVFIFPPLQHHVETARREARREHPSPVPEKKHDDGIDFGHGKVQDCSNVYAEQESA
eukprot:Clim_evm2s249 gene=Clim_evmTU2s249